MQNNILWVTEQQGQLQIQLSYAEEKGHFC